MISIRLFDPLYSLISLLLYFFRLYRLNPSLSTVSRSISVVLPYPLPLFIFPSSSRRSRASQTEHGEPHGFIYSCNAGEFSNYVNMACERWCFNRGCDGATRRWPYILLLLALYVFGPSLADNEYSESFLDSTCCALHPCSLLQLGSKIGTFRAIFRKKKFTR